MIKQNNWNTVISETSQEVHRGGQARWGEPLNYTVFPKHQSTFLHCKGIKSDAGFRQKLCSVTA